MRSMNPHVQYLQHVACTERIPWIEDVIVTKAHIQTCFLQLFDTRQPSSLRIRVEASLQVNVNQWIRDKVQIEAIFSKRNNLYV